MTNLKQKLMEKIASRRVKKEIDSRVREYLGKYPTPISYMAEDEDLQTQKSLKDLLDLYYWRRTDVRGQEKAERTNVFPFYGPRHRESVHIDKLIDAHKKNRELNESSRNIDTLKQNLNRKGVVPRGSALPEAAAAGLGLQEQLELTNMLGPDERLKIQSTPLEGYSGITPKEIQRRDRAKDYLASRHVPTSEEIGLEFTGRAGVPRSIPNQNEYIYRGNAYPRVSGVEPVYASRHPEVAAGYSQEPQMGVTIPDKTVEVYKKPPDILEQPADYMHFKKGHSPEYKDLYPEGWTTLSTEKALKDPVARKKIRDLIKQDLKPIGENPARLDPSSMLGLRNPTYETVLSSDLKPQLVGKYKTRVARAPRKYRKGNKAPDKPLFALKRIEGLAARKVFK